MDDSNKIIDLKSNDAYPVPGQTTNLACWDSEEVTESKVLTEAIRYEIYKKLNLTKSAAAELESMVEGAPARKVGKGALKNIKGKFYSKCNKGHRAVESHTCELVYALMLDLDPTVLGWYTQIECAGIRRTTQSGRLNVTAAKLDFLVYRSDSIDLVECKYRSELIRKVSDDKNVDWSYENDEWSHQALKAWADQRKIDFRVWVQDVPFAIEKQNLEAIHAVLDSELTPTDVIAANKVLKLLSKSPATIEQLNLEISNFHERIILWLLANKKVFGLVRSVSLDHDEHFYLYLLEEQAFELDERNYQRICRNLTQPVIDDPLLTASPNDIEKAKLRYKRLTDIENQLCPNTRRMQQLKERVDMAVKEGRSPLSACLTSYNNCGNRVSRFNSLQIKAINECITQFWNKNIAKTRKDLWFYVEEKCFSQGIEIPSYPAMCVYLKQENPSIKALLSGGMRAYQASVPRVDATKRSLSSIGYGHKVIIDSSQFDQRCTTNILNEFGTAVPTFYLAIDDATDEVMAISMSLSKSSTAGLAMLLREYYFRHGFLPAVIQFDRGSENESIWGMEFCDAYGITFVHTPTGGSKYNTRAENKNKLVCFQLAHKGPGSTEPDKAGRKVDGKFKSRKMARDEFLTLVKQMKDFVFGDLMIKPNNDGYSPNELRELKISKFGIMGVKVSDEYSFIINTSIKLKLPTKCYEKGGIRTKYGHYTNDELQIVLRTDQPSEIRRDCADPTRMYVKVRNKWYLAFNQDTLKFVNASNLEKYYEGLTWPILAKLQREGKLDIDRNRHHRLIADRTQSNDKPVEQLENGLPEKAKPKKSKKINAGFRSKDEESFWNDMEPEEIVDGY